MFHSMYRAIYTVYSKGRYNDHYIGIQWNSTVARTNNYRNTIGTAYNCSSVNTISLASHSTNNKPIVQVLVSLHTPRIFWSNFGPAYRQSLRDGPSDRAEAS